MNALSVQGLARARRRAGVPSLRSLGEEEDGLYLAPDWGTMAPVAGRADQVALTYRTPERGEIYVPPVVEPPKPFTLTNDARELPRFNRPPRPLPVEPFRRSFPHQWIPQTDMVAVATDDQPPMPRGWAPPLDQSKEEEAAVSAALPGPWAGEDQMAMDISGLHDAVPGIVTSYDALFQDTTSTPAVPSAQAQMYTQAAQKAVAAQAKSAQASGASPDVVDQIISFGSKIGAAVIATKYGPKPAPSAMARIFPPDEPFWKQPVFLGGSALLIGASAWAYFKGGGGRRRGTTRRRRR